ncbi:YifB family Mg chelatase-like AAA ATPase [Heliorestis acidaminivorans]|uniref:YifB family Mg chelatase-like AAA ATPase n=1 Tax=Heliorestis acidaminivorans TaxID=553427 RepID=A0A6I0FA45_9FIRM|nr:YifB family Mg chelatase-like AAA ATPase [Heliorestis acidaminivorans]KAB2954408.1 YifB family Mg chelatase-like AAA ATPase [Heliorestis acidaminivorans]
MLARVRSVVLEGMIARPVLVEVDVSNGLPAFDLVGLPATAVREARERVRTAIRNSGFSFPLHRITVNLAPAHVRKEGTVLDIPIALGVLSATGQVNLQRYISDYFVGELALDGSARPVEGILAMVYGLSKNHMNEDKTIQIWVPEANIGEASRITQLKSQAVKNLQEVIHSLQHPHEEKGRIINITKKSTHNDSRVESAYDLSQIKGQSIAKRALEITAAGGHNLLMTGPPGTGKTMLARCLPTILPPMSYQESLETTMIYSVTGGLLDDSTWITERPFRTPHHHSTMTALIGGGRTPRPGEISLAHHGVLFMDEWPEFTRELLDALRQPLEDGEVTISRQGGTYTFPSKFILVAAMNPCPCGYLGAEDDQECNCTPYAIERYKHRISGPLWDRMDIQVKVTRPKYESLRQKEGPEESSAQMRERVMIARERQLERLLPYEKKNKVFCNAHLDAELLEKTCILEKEAEQLLEMAYKQFHLSGRGLHRLIKVARTIADLRGAETISSIDLAEAIQYRL